MLFFTTQRVLAERFFFINSRTAIAGAIIGLLLVFLRLEEEYWFSSGFFFTGSTIRSDDVLT